MASTKISRTFSSAGNMNKWTISLWLKRAKLGVEQVIASCYENSNYQTQIKFESDDQLHFNDENNGNTNGRIVSNAKFRDTSGWYHMVFIWDKDNSTSGDKLRMYVNGVRITSFSDTGNAPSTSSTWNAANTTQQFGAKATSDYFDGIMSHIHFCDGYAYEPSNFGSTDSTTGEWKINTSPSVSYGTNGYWWLRDNVATTDNSPNSNTFTASGTLTKTEDCPSNVFCTLNPLTSHDYTFSNGNNTIIRGSGISSTIGSLATSSGKWYWEVKLVSGQSNYPRVGVYKASNADNHIHTTYIGNVSGGTGKWWGSGTSQTGVIANGTDSTTAFFSYSNGDILMFAMDNDNGKLWLGKNGTWYTNDNSTTTTGTAISNGTATPAFSNLTVGEIWAPSVFGNDSADVWSCNFGNGYFGTTQISSEGTNASGFGKFEYDVPTNFTALCTKGLNL